MVSIIIPIYNPGEALRRCLDSVINQSYRDIEIILINDGSTDTSGLICKEYVAKDDRIVYIDQQNSGVSTARNNGIVKARGEYIAFVDSDDSVDADYIECMVEAVIRSKADIVIQGLKSMRCHEVIGTDCFENGIFEVNTLSDALFDKIFYFCGPYCKLFKSSVIKGNNLRFPVDLAYGEDAVFYYEYLSKCRVIELIPNTGYNYSVGNQNALSTKTLHPDKFWQNQHNRRGSYKRLKKTFLLPATISTTELFCKMTGIGGMLNAIFKYEDNDTNIASYLDLIKTDSDFGFNELQPNTLKHRLTISLIRTNSRISRSILKIMYS